MIVSEYEKGLLKRSYLDYKENEEPGEEVREALDFCRKAEKYLKSKYPDINFRITQYIPPFMFSSGSEAEFIAEGYGRSYYVINNPENPEVLKDNLCALTVKGEYIDGITKMLNEKGIVISGCAAACSDYFGKEINGSEDFSTLANSKNCFLITIYGVFENPEEAHEKICTIITDAGFSDLNIATVSSELFKNLITADACDLADFYAEDESLVTRITTYFP